MQIPDEIMNAPIGEWTIPCLHQIALSPENTWQVFEDGAGPDSVLPVAQRRGTRVWFIQSGKAREIDLSEIRNYCLCASKQEQK